MDKADDSVCIMWALLVFTLYENKTMAYGHFFKCVTHSPDIFLTTVKQWDWTRYRIEERRGLIHKTLRQFLLQYPSSEVSSSLRFRSWALEPAFGQVHTSLACASLYPIDWGWVCHRIRIKVLRLSIKGGRAMRGTCQRFVCCQGLARARKRYGCRIAKASISVCAPKSLQDQTTLLPQ